MTAANNSVKTQQTSNFVADDIQSTGAPGGDTAPAGVVDPTLADSLLGTAQSLSSSAAQASSIDSAAQPAFGEAAPVEAAPVSAATPVSVAATATTAAVSSGSTVSTTASATATATVSSGTTATPSWVGTLQTASVRTDMTAADVNGTVSYSGLEKIVSDLDSTLSTSKTTLTAAELSDLKTIAANLNNGMTTSQYLTTIMTDLADGNAANATFTGGAAKSSTLGNLAAGSSATQLAELNDKWFLGTDLPSSSVTMTGYSSFTVSYSTVSNALFGTSGPSMNDVNQGYLGDCYFLSSLAEVAHQDAADITSMFTTNGNGTYGVRFYVDGQAEYVTVDSQLADGGTIFNYGTNIWASLAETAYAEFQAGGVTTGNSSVNYGNSFSTIGNGGDPAAALEAITGASQIVDFGANGGSWVDYTMNNALGVTNYTAGNSTSAVLATIVADLQKGDDVILTSYTNATDSSGRTTLVADHAMSIYGYDSSTGNLEIRNPWGSESGQYWDTTFEVSLSTLLSDGDWVTADNIGNGNTSPSAPTVTSQTAAQTWKAGQAVSFALASNTFTDPQGEALTYTAKLANGSALPAWLSFNASTRTFSGTPPTGAANLSVLVTATDTSGLPASETFTVNIVAPTAPTITSQTATQTWKAGQAVSFALASNTFTDPQGEALSYTASLSNGNALPSWLSFNATTKTFSGTPPAGAETLSLKVTAIDAGGASTAETFTANVVLPSAPTITSQTATQTWKAGQAVSFALASNTFTDPQGEALSYTASLSNGNALPSWLSFNATTKTFSGTPPAGAETLSLKVTAIDAGGASTAETFTANVVLPAAPTITNQTAAQSWTEGQSISLKLASNTFTDPQGESLTYTATQASGSALPTWLTFNAATDTFTGTTPSTASSFSIKVSATDSGGASTSETFTATIAAAASKLVSAVSSTSSTSSAVTTGLTSTASTGPVTLASPSH